MVSDGLREFGRVLFKSGAVVVEKDVDEFPLWSSRLLVCVFWA